MTRTTYVPPVSPDQLPRNSTEWRRRTGLTDPAVVAAHVRARVGEPAYGDFFRTP